MPTNDDPIFTAHQAAEYLNSAYSTLAKLRLFGGGPVYLKIGKAVRYRKSDLDAWLKTRRRKNTSQSLQEASEE